MKEEKITIQPNGPYVVSGGVPLLEMSIAYDGYEHLYEPLEPLPQRQTYALCRCGRSKNAPFCDGSHGESSFDGTETASRRPYEEQAEVFEGPGVVLRDAEGLCAFARFCHIGLDDVWGLTEASGDPENRKEAVKAAEQCPAGRLTAYDPQTGEALEPSYEPSIVVLQDPDRDCSGPLWVRGGIPIQSADGSVYEIRNRVTLCRCGHSRNKPFCDAGHVLHAFQDDRPPAFSETPEKPENNE